MLLFSIIHNNIAEQQSPAKRRRIDERWQSYTDPYGQSVDLPPLLIKMLNDNKFAPAPHSDFHALRNNLNAGDEIVIPKLGQDPKHFGEYFHQCRLLVTEQMLSIWQDI